MWDNSNKENAMASHDTSLEAKKVKFLQNALQRQIPLLTDAQVAEYRNRILNLRADFCAWAAGREFYFTLALLGTVEIKTDPSFPAIAGITNVERLTMYIHPLMAELAQKNKNAAFFIIMHELRHLIQCADMRAIENLIDLSPIREVYTKKRDEAKEQEHKDIWQKQIDSLDNKDNNRWKNLKYRASNITMDSALHEDLVKAFSSPKEIIAIINEFMADRFVPYLSGFSMEEQAKDKIAVGKFEEEIQNVLKYAGPKKKQEVEAALKKHNADQAAALAECMRLQIGLCTVEKLEDSFRNMPHYQPTLRREGEWLNYADEYIEWLAQQLDENSDANDPQQGEGEGGEGGEGGAGGDEIDEILKQMEDNEFDHHGMSGDKKEEAERRLREAVRKAQEEGRLMAHKAGKNAADNSMFGDATAALDAKIKKLLEHLHIKFVRLFAPSNEKNYNFAKINRIFNDIKDLPGRQKIEKPKKQVIMIADTSGSMWNKQWFNQIAAAAKFYSKSNKLAAFYCCDTEHHKIDLKSNFSQIEMQGGGGTELSPQLLAKMLEENNLSKNVDFVYLTDECVNGLEESLRDDRWKLHVINIPKVLGER